MDKFSSLHRRMADLDPFATEPGTPTMVIRAADEAATDAEPTSTIAPYYQELNGVNQPMNMAFKEALWWMLGGAAVIILAIRIGQLAWAQLRQVSAMSAPREKQGYWKVSQWSWMPALKKHFIYAPLGHKRHNREFRLSSAMNVGTLPSRFHTIIISVYLLSNLAYMFVLDWDNENKFAFCAEVRGRSGTLALVNMVPLIIMAGRNNPLIPLLQVSFDTYNLLHRWMGRVVVIESVIHTIAWAIPAVADLGWDGASKLVVSEWFLVSGLIGTVLMALLLLTSFSPVRHAFYETFLNAHIAMAAVIFACTWVHCDTAHIKGGLPQLPWIIGIVVLWALDRTARFVRLVYANYTMKDSTFAICEPMPCEATRVTLQLPRYMDIRPGTHAYLRFGGINFWESHPFSIAWVEQSDNVDPVLPASELEKNPYVHFDRTKAFTSVSFLIGAHTGITRKLYEAAKKGAMHGGHAIKIKAAMEGPYAGHHSLDSYGHVVLFAGSTGITHQLGYVRHLLNGYNDGTVATRRITLVWIIREYEALEWVRPYMDAILRIPNRKDVLRINVFVTRPQNARDITSASSTVKMFPGRPNIPLLLVKEIQEQIGAMCVTVCGPGALADDVRSAARAVQGETCVDLIEESFTW
ncbi:Ferric/cupric reductase transmembrane component-like protein [Hapsidospora chrysogenum ATCC 11550]|uniref:Ferric/cupric reductase transmembrane component-like protein n=1 Tax=Hapsidospora chrysogenum (strain ATCC 11550 / CBS 779.69 / DSM 880 / IAM 14645 / JCM 23072 / IMI 49137) TaxID=857340 RepID=A0A086T0J2_HAPC1|nr:Ferric/cupric reductase transmembrane component-like protein [Hapsidospora chrysogenum ATCC 11550]